MEFEPAFNFDQENVSDNAFVKRISTGLVIKVDSDKKQGKRFGVESDSTQISHQTQSKESIPLKTICINPTLFNKIYEQRDEYNLFTKLSLIPNTDKSWFFKNNKPDTMRGPFNNKEMDSFFKDKTLNRNTIIQCVPNTKQFSLSYYVKKYYKSFMIDKGEPEQPSFDLRQCLKRQTKKRKRLSDITDYQSKSLRTEGLVTHLAFTLEEDNSDSEEEGSIIETRQRSYTLLS